MTSIEMYEKKVLELFHMYANGDIDIREFLTTLHNFYYKVEEMHKQEIIDAWEMGRFNIDAVGLGEQYYQETFVSKGSDEVELPKHPSVISENGNELLFDKEGNLIKELPQQETLYTEEQMIGFSEWILNSDSKKVLTRTKESLLKEYIESLKQPKQ